MHLAPFEVDAFERRTPPVSRQLERTVHEGGKRALAFIGLIRRRGRSRRPHENQPPAMMLTVTIRAAAAAAAAAATPAVAPAARTVGSVGVGVWGVFPPHQSLRDLLLLFMLLLQRVSDEQSLRQQRASHADEHTADKGPHDKTKERNTRASGLVLHAFSRLHEDDVGRMKEKA